MEQTAFAMKLKPGAIGKHRRRHDKTRPEGLKANTLAGLRGCAIFCGPETLMPFAVRRLADDKTMESRKKEACFRKRRDHNAGRMARKPGNEPSSRPLRLAFHMD